MSDLHHEKVVNRKANCMSDHAINAGLRQLNCTDERQQSHSMLLCVHRQSISSLDSKIKRENHSLLFTTTTLKKRIQNLPLKKIQCAEK